MRGRGVAGQTILGLDNIRLDVPVAGVGSRALALAVDYLCLAVLLLLWLLGMLLWNRVQPSNLVWVVALVGFFLLEHGYFIVSELASGGRTLGKQAVRLRVVNRTGGRPGGTALLLRNLLRLVDLLVGVFLVAADPWGRRLGDRLAGTLVIHEPRPRQGATLERPPAGWGPREVAVAESWLLRWRQLEPERARSLARRLLRWIEEDEPALLTGRDVDREPARVLEEVLTAPAAATTPGSGGDGAH